MKKEDQKITAENNKLVDERLRKASEMTIDDLFHVYQTSWLGKEEVSRDEARSAYGVNKIERFKKLSLGKRIFNAFFDPFTLILLVLSIVSFTTDFVLANPNDKNPTTFLIILCIVMISGILRFTQESKSGEASEKLLEMIENTCMVSLPKQGSKEIPMDELVVGDLVYLSAGDMIPADVRIVQSKDLFISQSALTGEAVSVEKFVTCQDHSLSTLSLDNLAFMGTNVVSGSAKAVVISTGMDTFFGRIASHLNQKKEMTQFEKGINSVSWILIRFMLTMVPVVFVITGFTKGDWLNSFIFAISIAVGLTPEMLPMIVTTCLSVGSMEMAKNKVIIKNLNSIQSLGAMNILCTDKTGTLTEDKIVLQRHINIHGQEDTRVLRYGFLNSFYQTGLKNLMDKAIISKTMELKEKDNNLEENIDRYEKIDEIPFDFSRRRMSVVVKNNHGVCKLITKGAVEEMLAICSYIESDGKAIALNAEIKEHILKTVQELNAQNMRVIAVAYKRNLTDARTLTVQDEKDMILMGYLSFLDPAKDSAKEAIKTLKEYGINVKVLTGDNKEVTLNVCQQLKIKTDHILLGDDIEKMNDQELSQLVEKTSVFAKLSPSQKVRIIELLKNNGHTVGFMGDGINDAAGLEKADVGISVSNAVDIAKESANVILLEKDLMVLEKGVIEGRKIYANMLKYIKITASSNFGNVFSILFASLLIPFLPMQPIHLLILNMIYDISCISFPWDNVDISYLKEPRKWEAKSISSFMIQFGPISSIFDFLTYFILYYQICPLFTNGVLFTKLADPKLKLVYIAIFHAGWFIESMLSQTLVIHMLRTSKIPFKQSRPSTVLLWLNTISIFFVFFLVNSDIGMLLGFHALPRIYLAYLLIIIVLYMILISLVKKHYLKNHAEIL